MLVDKWSECSLSTPTIRVRILLKPRVLSVNFVLEKNKKQKGLAHFFKKSSPWTARVWDRTGCCSWGTGGQSGAGGRKPSKSRTNLLWQSIETKVMNDLPLNCETNLAFVFHVIVLAFSQTQQLFTWTDMSLLHFSSSVAQLFEASN